MRFLPIAVLVVALGAPCARAADTSAAPASPVTPAARAADTATIAATPAIPAARGLKIGYVDLSRVWLEYHRRADFDNDYKALRLELANQDRTRTDEIARDQQQIEKLAMGTPERLELEEKAKTAVKETEDFRRSAAAEINQKFVTMLNALFGEVLKETEAVARDGNYDFIIKDQSPDPNVNSRADAVLQLGQRVVLYAKPEYDLTSAVVKRLNDKYDAERKIKQTAPASPKPPEAPTKEK